VKDPRVDDLLETVKYLQELVRTKESRNMTINVFEKLADLRRRVEKLERANAPTTYTIEVTKVPSSGFTPKGFVDVEICGTHTIIPSDWIK